MLSIFGARFIVQLSVVNRQLWLVSGLWTQISRCEAVWISWWSLACVVFICGRHFIASILDQRGAGLLSNKGCCLCLLRLFSLVACCLCLDYFLFVACCVCGYCFLLLLVVCADTVFSCCVLCLLRLFSICCLLCLPMLFSLVA